MSTGLTFFGDKKVHFGDRNSTYCNGHPSSVLTRSTYIFAVLHLLAVAIPAGADHALALDSKSNRDSHSTMGRKHGAKTGGAAASVLKKQLSKNSQGKKAQPIESDNESEDSGNYMTFNKKDKDSDDEEDREVFNLAMDKDEDDEVRANLKEVMPCPSQRE